MTDDDTLENTARGRASAAAGSDTRLAVAVSTDRESFPVLQAFQSFLDQERERSRRRIMVLSTIFISTLAVITAVFGVFAIFFFSHMMARNEAQQDRMLDLITHPVSAAPASPPSAAAAAPVPAPTTVDIEKMVEKLVAERLKARESAPVPGAQEGDPPPAAPKREDAASAEPQAPFPERRRGIISPVSRRQSGQSNAPQKAEKTGSAPQNTQEPPNPPEKPRSSASKEAAPASAPAGAARGKEPRRISVQPTRALSVPRGYVQDSTIIQTESGALVPLRTLLPDLNAEK